MSDSKLFQKIQDYFCMVNGIYLSCLQQYKGKKIKLFIIGCILMSAIQYALSFILETIVGARLWNYTWSKFNINGRVCLPLLVRKNTKTFF